MILYMYAYKNSLAGFFAKPFLDKIEPKDMSEVIKVSIAQQGDDILKSLIEDDLYFVGTYDTETANIISKPEFILHVGDMAKLVLENKNKKEGVDDGKGSDNA